MSTINFYTPVLFANNEYRTPLNRLREAVDSYFYLGRHKVMVEDLKKNHQGQVTGLCVTRPASWQQTLLKVALYTASALAFGILVAQPTWVLTSLALKVTVKAVAMLPVALLILKASWRLPMRLVGETTDERSALNVGLDKHSVSNLESKLIDKLFGANTAEPEFTFPGYPALTFKSSLFFKTDPSGTDSFLYHALNFKKAAEVIFEEALSQIATPRQAFITVIGTWVKVERKSPIEKSEEQIKQEYTHKAHPLLFKQLATFIAKTGWNYVTWKTIPLIATADRGDTVMLTDLSSMSSAAEGLFGNSKYCGLLNCATTMNEIQEIRLVAKQYNIQPPNGQSIDQVCNNRQKVAEEALRQKNLQRWYDDKRCSADTEIRIDICKQPTYPNSFGGAMYDLLEVLNDLTQKAPKEGSVAAARCVTLDFQANETLKRLSTQIHNGHTWIEILLHALQDKGYIPPGPIPVSHPRDGAWNVQV